MNNTIKTAYMKWQYLDLVSTELVDRCYEDPENEALEAESESAYEEAWEALKEFAETLERETGGEVSAKTAKKMALNPKYSKRLEHIMMLAR